MARQSGRNIKVAYKEESTFGTLPGATSGKVFRANSGSLALTKEPITSNENRSDGQMSRGRHGMRSVSGQYSADLSLGSFDDFFQAAFRGTFEAELTITEATASLASITTGTNTIVAGGGSWITAGLRVGDVIRVTNHATSANNGKNLRITGLTASTITVAETLTTNATPDTAFTITRPKKLIMGTTARSFTLEEVEQDIDASEVFTGVRVGGFSLSMEPNGMAVVTFDLIGKDMEVKTGADSPYFTDPTATTSIGLTAVEAVIRLGSEDLVDVTALDLSVNLNASGQPMVGATTTPDVFTNLATVEGSITTLREDMDRVSNFLDEDQLSLHLLFAENEGEPKDFISFFIGNLTLSSATKSELGADGPRTQQLAIMCGIDETGTSNDETMIKYQTSAA